MAAKIASDVCALRKFCERYHSGRRSLWSLVYLTQPFSSEVRARNTSVFSVSTASIKPLIFSPIFTVAMQSWKARRKVGSTASNGVDAADKLDQLLLSSAICNNEDLCPFVRKAFAAGKPETLHHLLRDFARSKESEIEDVCRAHYQDFIMAVDDLRSLLSDVDSLKSSLYNTNSKLQSASGPLLSSLDALVEARHVSRNVKTALESVQNCVQIMELCSRANLHIANESFYVTLKCLDSIECSLHKTPSSTLRKMLEKQISEIRNYIERRIKKQFGDWLVEIRTVSRNLGQIAIGQASSARQREEELRIKQRQAEEQSWNSSKDCLYALQDEEDDHDGKLGFDLTPLYRAHHIHQTLGLEDQFNRYYYENRKLQLTSDFQVSSMTPFLESHQTFFAQIAGFFIVEDKILRTGGGLISKTQVENLWEIAVNKMCSVLEDQFSRMQTANHLLLIKDYVSLLTATLRKYGYSIDSLLEVLNKHKEKYHELLLSDCHKQITEALAADKFEQMLMKKEYEYSMNVLSFQLQTSDIAPAFPHIAPFSSTVPDCCRIVRSFIEDSVSFMSHGGYFNFYDIVKKYLDRLLTEVLEEALVKLITTSINGVSQAMQMAANMVVFERACEFFFRHAAQLSGVPSRIAERGGRGRFPLKKAMDAAEAALSELLKTKVDGFMLLMENINWLADETLQNGNEYINEVIIYLETLVSTAQHILPTLVLRRVLQDVLSHISDKIVAVLVDDSVKRFTPFAVSAIDEDVRLLESFVDSQSPLFSDSDVKELKQTMIEARQLVNLLLNNHPENFLNPVIREKSYNTLDYKKVVAASEKLKDPSDRLFGSFGGRGVRQNPKKKSLDTLIKRLKDVT